MGLSSILSTSTAGLQAVQAQLQWRTDNISNAQDPTYARRDAVTVAVGANSVSVDVRRASDDGLQNQFLSANALSSASSTRQGYFQSIGDIVGTSQTTSYLQQALDNFTGAWKSFETDPSSTTSESQIVSTGQTLAQTITEGAQQLTQLDTEVRTDIGNTVTDLNNKLQDLDKVNKQLGAEPLATSVDPGLFDQRDQLVRDISSIVGVTRIIHSDGTVALYTETGTALLDHGAQQFQWNNAAGAQPWISLAPPAAAGGSAPGLNAGFSSGKLGAALNFIDGTYTAVASTDPNVGVLAKAKAQFDIVASQLADNTVTPTAGLPQLNTFGGAYYYSQSDRPTDLMGGPAASWPGPPPTLPTTPLTAVPPTTVTTPMSSFFTIDNGQIGPPLQPPSLTASQSFAINTSLVDGTATVKRQAATSVIAALTDINRSMAVAQTGDTAAGSNVLLNMSQTYGLTVGMTVNGAGIPGGTIVQAIDPLNGTVTLNNAATVSNSTSPLSFNLVSLNVTNLTYSGLMSTIANSQSSAQSAASTDTTRLTQTTQTLDTRLSSKVGVNMDTEMAQLTVLQNAYAANARVINTVQAMFDTLIGIAK